jgi:hypothetical protein
MELFLQLLAQLTEIGSVKIGSSCSFGSQPKLTAAKIQRGIVLSRKISIHLTGFTGGQSINGLSTPKS